MTTDKKRKRRIQAAAVTLCYMAIIYNIFWNDEFMEANEVKPYKWEPTESAKNMEDFLILRQEFRV